MDELAFLGGLLCSGSVLFLLLGLPMLLLLRRTRTLAARLEKVEHQVGRLRVQLREEAPGEKEGIAAPASPVPAVRAREPSLPQSRPRGRPLPAVLPGGGEGLELWIGRRGLGWIAVVLLLFATAFFVKYAFENQWVGPLGRVSMGVVAGLVLCLGGLWYHRRDWVRFSQMLTAGGVVLLYLATFSAFGYYQLLPRERATLFMIALVVETAGLALLYEAPAIAFMAVIGGLLNPMLLSTGRDQYISLFSYLFLLNTGTVVLIVLRQWPGLGTVSLLGTQALFLLWFEAHFHPAKLNAALLFEGGLLVLYLLPTVVEAMRRRFGTLDDLLRLIVQALVGVILFWLLIREDYPHWTGAMALLLAVVFAATGWLVNQRHAMDTPQVLTLVAIALSLGALVFPLQLKGMWIALGWAMSGTLLWWFGLRVQIQPLRLLGGVLLGLAIGRFLLIDGFAHRQELFIPLLNVQALSSLALAGCVLLTAWTSAVVAQAFRRREEALVALITLGLGLVLVWVILSHETLSYFDVRMEQLWGVTGSGTGPLYDPSGRDLFLVQHEEVERLRFLKSLSLSLVWGAYAGVLLAIGFWRQLGPMRWAALILFGITLLKLVFWDMAALPGFYRVTAFFALAVLLGLAAWIYQKVQLSRRETQGETSNGAA